MKNILLIILAAIISLYSFGQGKDTTGKDSLKKPLETVYAVRFTDQSLALLYEIINKSEAPHIQVEAMKAYIGSQLTKQIPKTNK